MLKLRTNTYPCKATLARGREIDTTCRCCGLTVETKGNISGHCMAVKDYRIKRHNFITKALSEKVKQAGWKVTHEPKLRDENNGMFKPDLIAVKENKAVVLDLTIVFENEIRCGRRKKLRLKSTHAWIRLSGKCLE